MNMKFIVGVLLFGFIYSASVAEETDSIGTPLTSAERDDVCAQYNGITNANEDTCCATSCGTCGGSGCGDRDGGSANCCVSVIQDEGYQCGTRHVPEAPCCITCKDWEAEDY